MTIKVYGYIRSGVRVWATLFEKDVTDFESVQVDMRSGANKKPEYLAIQPFGKIPAIVDGSLTLFESRAIARYIAHKYEGQGTPLFGSTPKDAALVEQWLEVEGQNINPPVSTLIYELLAKKRLGEEADKAVVKTNVEKLSTVLDVYEMHLSENKYLAGDFFSLADLSHLHLQYLSFAVLHDKQFLGIFEGRPHAKAWWEDISSRPTWKKVFALVAQEIKSQ